VDLCDKLFPAILLRNPTSEQAKSAVIWSFN